MSKRALPPWYFLLPALVAGLGVALPLAYLVMRALEVNGGELRSILLRRRNVELFANTAGLAAAVVSCSTLIAAPLAWLTVRTNLRGRHLMTLFSILPLSIPGYVVGYALLGIGAPSGPFAKLAGSTPPHVSGFGGALAALVIYNFPIVYLHLRTAFAGIDPSLTEAARSLGLSPVRSFVRVLLPQLWPAYLSAVLLVTLYVVGDFGVVSLMRFETFSYAIYLQYIASYDRAYAAWLGLMLLTVTAVLVVAEFRLLRDLSLERTGRGSPVGTRVVPMGNLKWIAYAFAALVAAGSVLFPVWSIIYWLGRSHPGALLGGVGASLAGTLAVSAPAAVLATLLAVPIAYLSRRHPSAASHVLERSTYVGYATPALAFALGVVFVVLRAAPWMYQTAGLLIFAYTIHFLAQAVGPVRAGLHLATPHVEEASRALGLGPVATFRRVTIPILRPGLAAASVLVFLSCVKELPLTLILAPLNFESLALNVYSYTTEAMFAEAAPYALTIVLLSAFLTGVVFRRVGEGA